MSDLNLVEAKINYVAVWFLAKRELLDFWRNKSRVISSIMQAVLFLFVFGFINIGAITIGGVDITPRRFIASGVPAMVIVFTGIFGGMSIFRDKMFGFMKELLVAPVSRKTLMLGRTAGIGLQTMIQVIMMILLGAAIGYFGYDDVFLILRIFIIIPIAFLASLGVVGIGLTISTRLEDMQSFGLIQTFLVMPMMFLSGAIFPLPPFIIMFDPFSYCVDLIRFILIGVSNFPIWLDFIVVVLFGAFFILLGAWSFNKMEST